MLRRRKTRDHQARNSPRRDPVSCQQASGEHLQVGLTLCVWMWRCLRAGHMLWSALRWMSGDVLVSHTISRAVPSALKGLTSGFGMEPGVSLSP